MTLVMTYSSTIIYVTMLWKILIHKLRVNKWSTEISSTSIDMFHVPEIRSRGELHETADHQGLWSAKGDCPTYPAGRGMGYGMPYGIWMALVLSPAEIPLNAKLLQGAGLISRHCLKRHFNERNASGRGVKVV